MIQSITAFTPAQPQYQATSLAAAKTATSPTGTQSKTIFQKVVRSPNPDTLIVGRVVEYLQEEFRVPPTLPLPYTPTVVSDDPAGTVLQLVSPAVPQSQLRIQVVAMVETPHLAMVVVVHESPTSGKSGTKIPPMLAQLVVASVKGIVQALEQGMEEGVGAMVEHQQKQQSEREALTAREHALQQEKMVREFVESSSTSNEDSSVVVSDSFDEKDAAETKNYDAIDAVVVKDEKETRRQQQLAWNAMHQPAVEKPIAVQGGSDDFAVAAAKLARAQRSRNRGSDQDYAVRAAKQRLQESNSKTTEQQPPTQVGSNHSSEKSIQPTDQRLPVLDTAVSGVERNFMASISTPEKYTAYCRKDKRKSIPNATKTKKRATVDNLTSATPKSSRNKKVAESKKLSGGQELSASKKVDEPPSATMDESQISCNSAVSDRRQVNLRSTPEVLPEMVDVNAVPAKDPAEKEMMHSTQQVLDEMANSGTDMSPEELLADVMQFGEENSDEPGKGFVNAALETAKGLLRDQHKKRQNKMKAKLEAQAEEKVSPAAAVETLTPDEELRRMFAAGERFANGLITTTTTTSSASSESLTTTSPEDEELIDRVIAANDDKSVSSHARVLDDELVELELRIAKSVGEEFDNADKHPIFDIFSGPEVYNPNVDPATAVNWPGALPGTKEMRLPKELEEAKKQANFAVHVLMNLKEVETDSDHKEYSFGAKKLTEAQVESFRRLVEDAVELGIVDDPIQLQAEEDRLQMLLDELWTQPDERIQCIAENYKDLMLSDYFVQHVKKRLSKMSQSAMSSTDKEEHHKKQSRERVLLGHLVTYAQLLLKETQALGAQLEAQQLEVIRSICKVAMDPRYTTEEETAMALTDAVRDMRPMFDDAFVAYIKYAVAEEKGRLARAGLLDDPEESRWYMVLQVVQQGVYAEIAKGINRYLDHIWYILRMETPVERRMLLEELVNVMPTLDVRPFVRVVENIAGALGDSVRGEFDGAVPLGEMTNKILQLYRDTKEVLPPERIAEKSRDADEWAAKQKQKLLEQREVTQQRLKGAAKTEHLDGKIDAMERSGEYERFD